MRSTMCVVRTDSALGGGASTEKRIHSSELITRWPDGSAWIADARPRKSRLIARKTPTMLTGCQRRLRTRTRCSRRGGTVPKEISPSGRTVNPLDSASRLRLRRGSLGDRDRRGGGPGCRRGGKGIGQSHEHRTRDGGRDRERDAVDLHAQVFNRRGAQFARALDVDGDRLVARGKYAETRSLPRVQFNDLVADPSLH